MKINTTTVTKENRIHIAPTRGWVSLHLRDLWVYRELLYFLTWRDIKVRYKQTVLGAAWAIIQPFFTMVIFSIFFGRLAGLKSDGLPYPIWSFAALLPWTFVSVTLAQASSSLVMNANLIKRVYFPRLVVPISSVLSGLVDLGIAFVVLVIMMPFFNIRPSWGLLLLPAFVLLAIITALAAGVWLSALNVQYRDIRYAVPFLTQFWFYASPVVYSTKMLDEPWRTLYGINPMVGVIEGFRWALLGTTPPGPLIAISILVSLILLVSGIYYFRRMEKNFADVV